MDGPRRRTLEMALRTVGNSKERLAIALDVTLSDLEKYLSAETRPPHKVFLEALDIVAHGLYGPTKKKPPTPRYSR